MLHVCFLVPETLSRHRDVTCQLIPCCRHTILYCQAPHHFPALYCKHTWSCFHTQIPSSLNAVIEVDVGRGSYIAPTHSLSCPPPTPSCIRALLVCLLLLSSLWCAVSTSSRGIHASSRASLDMHWRSVMFLWLCGLEALPFFVAFHINKIVAILFVGLF